MSAPRTVDLNELEAEAIQSLRDVMSSSTATPSARAQASRTILEFTKSIGSHAKKRTNGATDPGDMSAEELASAAQAVQNPLTAFD